MPEDARVSQVRCLLPEGTRIAIKAPYYKVYLDGTSGIRVDNPADVMFVTDAQQSSLSTEVISSGDDCAQGKQAFR